MPKSGKKKSGGVLGEIEDLLSSKHSSGGLVAEEDEGYHDGSLFEDAHDEEHDHFENFEPSASQKLSLQSLDLADEDEQYQGKKTAAKDALLLSDEDESEQDGLFDGENDSDEELDGSEESSSNGEESDAESVDSDSSSHLKHGRYDDEMRAIEQLEEQQRKSSIQISTSDQKEMSKASAVARQKACLDGLTETRITMQRAILAANRLPQYRTMRAFKQHSGEQLAEAQNMAVAEVLKVTNSLLKLRCELSTAFPGCPTIDEDSLPDLQIGSKRSLSKVVNDAWEAVKKTEHNLGPFRDSTIDKWSAKARLASGGVVQTKFKALDQTVLTQVSNVLKDPRSRHRIHMRRTQYRVLGFPEAVVQSGDNAAPVEDSSDEEGRDAHSDKEDSAVDEVHDFEVFDDNDFYQVLLRDLVAAADSQSGAANDLRKQLMDSRSRKLRRGKIVDTKASKGRKLRYHVHPKLVNFMFPQELDRPDFAKDLFTTLFGANSKSYDLSTK